MRPFRPAWRRRLITERLEQRQLLAADWQNPSLAADINGDGRLTALDSLIAINELTSRSYSDVDGVLFQRSRFPEAPFFDVSGDGAVAASDALVVINRLNAAVDHEALSLVAFAPSPHERPTRQTVNLNASDTTNTNQLWSGGGLNLDLNGAGYTVGVWDEGHILETHQEFQVGSGPSRVAIKDGTADYRDHATHVGGTIGAEGDDANARGMANALELWSYDWDSDLAELTSAASTIVVSNHSYSYIRGWAFQHFEEGPEGAGLYPLWSGIRNLGAEDSGFGRYDTNARSLDETLHSNPGVLSVWAASNDRGEHYTNWASLSVNQNHYLSYINGNYQWKSISDPLYPAPPPDCSQDGGFDCLPEQQTAKNSLVVGAVADVLIDPIVPNAVTSTSFSSWGSTDDGRIKPDVVGNGVSVYSAISTGNVDYASQSGTSMASPNVAGTAALLVEHYENQFPNRPSPLSATTKGLILHTALDAGNVGPDFTYGWGLVDAAAAANLLTDAASPAPTTSIQEHIYSGTTSSIQLLADGSGPLKATIVWNDLPGPAQSGGLDSPTPILVNDLDLSITSGGVTHHPWTLDANNPSAPAVRTASNHLDNVEQVLIETPVAGIYTLNVGRTGPSFSQAYSLVVSGASIAETSVSLDQAGNLEILDINGGNSNDSLTLSVNSVNLRVHDPNLELAAGTGATQIDAHTVEVPLSSINGPLGIQVNTSDGDDTIHVDGLGALAADLAINGQGGTDTVSLNGAITFAADKSLTIDADSIHLPNATSDISTSGSGSVTFTADRQVTLSSESSFSTVDGGITISANGAGSVTGDFVAIAIDNAAIQTTGSGSITLTGVGADLGIETGSSLGIEIDGATTISSSAAGASAGAITMHATAGPGIEGSSAFDLFGEGALITSVDGDITITGLASSGSGSVNVGLYISEIDGIRSTGIGTNAAKINITGLGGSGGSFNRGIWMDGDTSEITSVDGDITLSGTAGAGSNEGNDGIFWDEFGAIQSTGTGTEAAKISLLGQAGTGTGFNVGIGLHAATIAAVDGNVSITGVGGNGSGDGNRGVNLQNGSVVQVTDATLAVVGTAVSGNSEGVRLSAASAGNLVSLGQGAIDVTATGNGTEPDFEAGGNSVVGGTLASGPISISADTVDLQGTMTIQSSGELTIRPRSSNADIHLGAGATNSGLQLTDLELGRLAPGFQQIRIGDKTLGSGVVAIEAATFDSPVSVVGGAISVTQLNAATHSVSLSARTGAIVDGGDTLVDVNAASLFTSAHSGIGSTANPIEIAVTNWEGTGGNGGIHVANTGDLTIGGSAPTDGVGSTGGDIDITVSGNLLVNERIANSGGGNISLATASGGDLTISADVLATGGNGEINIGANQDLVINNDAEISTIGAGNVTAVAERSIQTASDSATTSIATTDGDISLTANELQLAGDFEGIHLLATDITTVTGVIAIVGTSGTQSLNEGVLVEGASRIRSTGIGPDVGDIKITGKAPASAAFHGLRLASSGTLVSAVDADILLQGNANNDAGIQVYSSAVVQSTGTGANAGNIQISGSTDDGKAVQFSQAGSSVLTIDGDINIVGVSDFGTGVQVGPSSLIASTGTGAQAGTITITGTKGGGNHLDEGVLVLNGDVTSIDGDVVIAGAAANRDGVHISGIGSVSSTGTTASAATISISGTTQDNFESGVRLTSSGSSQATVQSIVGDIDITGTSAGGNGVFIGQSAIVQSIGSADVSIVGNTTGTARGIYSLSSVLGGTGNVSLSSPNKVDLLGNSIVDSDGGNISVESQSSSITMSESATIDANSGLIDLNATTEISLGLLETTGSVSISSTSIRDTSDLTDITASSVMLAGAIEPGASLGVPGILNVDGDANIGTGQPLRIEIDGATPGNDAGHHDQLAATGNVNIASSASLVLSALNGFIPESEQSFTVVQRSGGTGTFAGLAEGTILADFLGITGVDAKISYVGGDGDDVVVTVVPRVWTVDTLADTPDANPGDGLAADAAGNTSLRAAIEEANSLPTRQEIIFSASLTSGGPATIVLDGSDLDISDDTILIGPGSESLTIGGANLSRAFNVGPSISVTLSGLTLRDGRAQNGGGILNQGDLTLSDISLRNNTATGFVIPGVVNSPGKGGGIYNLGGSLVGDQLIVAENVAPTGAAIHSSGSANLSDSTFSSNTGNSIFQSGAGETLAISRSSISGSSATAVQVQAGSSAVLEHTTLTGNAGAIEVGVTELFGDSLPATLSVINSTVSGNDSASTGGVEVNPQSQATIRNSTIVNNRGSQAGINLVGGGGVFNLGGTIVMHNTIVAGNLRGSVANEVAHDVGGTLEAGSSNNLVQGTLQAGGLVDGVDGNIVGLDPMLDTLADNGGPNTTHRLQQGSPAINAGSNSESRDAAGAPLPFDQRGTGFERILDSTVDIGAVEFVDTTPPTITDVMVGSSQWTSNFIDAVDGDGVGAGNGVGMRLAPNSLVTNAAVDRIYVQFSEHVLGFEATNVQLIGVNVSDYVSIATLTYDAQAHRGMIALSSAIEIEKVRLAVAATVTDSAGNSLDGDGSGSGVFDMRFDVAAGDGNGDGFINGGDLAPIGAAFNTGFGQVEYVVTADYNADGFVNGGDISVVGIHFNQALPVAEPDNPSFPNDDSQATSTTSLDEFFDELGKQDSSPLVEPIFPVPTISIS